VGNHEFDRGKAELKRLQTGGCAQGQALSDPMVQSCARTGAFEGARFPYLAANVIDDDTGELLFAATHVRRFGQVAVGFIGLTLRDTPQTTRGAKGLTFLDEVQTIEKHARQLKQDGVDAVVVLLHEGGSTTASSFTDQSCPGLSGRVKSIVESLPSFVDVVLSAHTHYDYICQINGILLSQAGSYGRMVTEIDLTIEPGRGVISKLGRTLPVINDRTKHVPPGYTILSPDPEVARLVDFYDQLTLPQRSRGLGFIDKEIVRADIDGAGQLVRSGTRIDVADHPIGRVFADALQAVPGPNGEQADVAFINPGGLRNYLSMPADGKVDYDALFGVAPFGDALYWMEMTGESLLRLLEQQWEAPNCGGKKFKGICGRILQPSHTLTYTWTFSPEDQGKPAGAGKMIDVNSLRIHGQPIVMDAVYKVVTIEFLAIYGGDNFSEFTDRSMRMKNLAINDIQALQAYLSRFTSDSRLMPPAPRIGCVRKVTNQDCGIPVL
jgi:5'-nucleotidase